jgi:hypothetical protein
LVNPHRIGEVIRGKIGRALEDDVEDHDLINKRLSRPVRGNVHFMRISLVPSASTHRDEVANAQAAISVAGATDTDW